MQPYRGKAWWAHGDDHCICANILPALLPTRIGSVDPHALKTTARRTESTLPENAPSHFTLRRASARIILTALLPTRIGSVVPHAFKTAARRTESTLPENAPSHFTLRRDICGLARRLVRIAARGARNGRLPNDLWWGTSRRNAPSTGSSAGTISDWNSALPKQAAAAMGCTWIGSTGT
jgi:hypothetical protein